MKNMARGETATITQTGKQELEKEQQQQQNMSTVISVSLSHFMSKWILALVCIRELLAQIFYCALCFC